MNNSIDLTLDGLFLRDITRNAMNYWQREYQGYGCRIPEVKASYFKVFGTNKKSLTSIQAHRYSDNSLLHWENPLLICCLFEYKNLEDEYLDLNRAYKKVFGVDKKDLIRYLSYGMYNGDKTCDCCGVDLQLLFNWNPSCYTLCESCHENVSTNYNNKVNKEVFNV